MKLKITLIMLLFPALIFAQGILPKVQAKFESLNSFQSNFKQEIILKGKKSSDGLSGKFTYAKPDSYKIEMSKRVIISDGNSIWNHDKSNNKVVITSTKDDPLSFSLKKFLFDYPERCQVTEEKNKIKLIPEDDELGMEKIFIEVNDFHLVTSIELMDFEGNRYIFTLSQIKENIKIETGFFNFIPPKGSKIIDLR